MQTEISANTLKTSAIRSKTMDPISHERVVRPERRNISLPAPKIHRSHRQRGYVPGHGNCSPVDGVADRGSTAEVTGVLVCTEYMSRIRVVNTWVIAYWKIKERNVILSEGGWATRLENKPPSTCDIGFDSVNRVYFLFYRVPHKTPLSRRRINELKNIHVDTLFFF